MEWSHQLLVDLANQLDTGLLFRRVDARHSPRSGDVSPDFMCEAGRCSRTVYDRNLQSTQCIERPTFTGRWFCPRDDRWWRVWACTDHLEGLTGIRHFGGRTRSYAAHFDDSLDEREALPSPGRGTTIRRIGIYVICCRSRADRERL
jgi:hypothetical protein